MRNIYLYIVAATLVFGWLMPQTGKNRKYYIILMTLIHIFVAGFRYNHLTGDLMKYHHTFNIMADSGWFSENVINSGKNTGFMMFLKLVNHLTGGDFQMVLIIIAVVIQVVLAYMIWRYSPAPWMSFLVWNCLGFYLFGFNAIKQAFAMAFVMLSFIGIEQKKPKCFLFWMAIAGFIHMPSLIFLPAYWFCQRKIRSSTVAFYVLLGTVLFLLKDQFVGFIKSFYYEDDQIFIFSGELGSRFIMLLGFSLFSILFSGFENRNLEKLFPLMAISTMLQMLAGYDHIFTRMTDYYFQFSVLYLPMLFFRDNQPTQHFALRPVFAFNRRSKYLMAAVLCLFVMWFYYTYNINITIVNAVDNYLNYRFMWDVK